MNYNFLKKKRGQNNAGGPKSRLYLAHVEDFLVIEKPIDRLTATAVEELVIVSNDHTFDVDDGFLEIDTAQTNSMISEELVSNGPDSGVKKINAEFIFPGSEEEVAGFELEWRYADVIILYPTLAGKIIQIGTEEIPARIEGAFKTGSLDSPEAGTAFTITAYNSSLLFYNGVITKKTIA